MSLGPIGTNPAAVGMATTDVIPYGVDMTNALPSGGSVSGVTCLLTDLRTGQKITLEDNPTVAGNVVTQIVRGSQLVAGHYYRLTIVFSAATNTVLTVAVEIACLI